MTTIFTMLLDRGGESEHFVLFLLSEENFKAFTVEYDVSCELVTYGLYIEVPNSLWYCHERMLNFVRLCLLLFHIYWFAHAEPSLHPRDKSLLSIMCDSFNVIWNLVTWYFIEAFCIHIHERYCPVIFFSYLVLCLLWYKWNTDLVKLVWKYFHLFNFIEEFEKDFH